MEENILAYFPYAPTKMIQSKEDLRQWCYDQHMDDSWVEADIADARKRACYRCLARWGVSRDAIRLWGTKYRWKRNSSAARILYRLIEDIFAP